jgi:hypothetical protein
MFGIQAWWVSVKIEPLPLSDNYILTVSANFNLIGVRADLGAIDLIGLSSLWKNCRQCPETYKSSYQ